MIATSFWEAYVEGRNAWDKGKYGWKINFAKNFKLTGYHFFLFGVTFPLLLLLPLVVSGWDTKLFGVLFSAYTAGLVIEDLFWYIVNPVVKFKEHNPNFANYYPWLKLGRINIPLLYLLALGLSLASWYFLWR